MKNIVLTDFKGDESWEFIEILKQTTSEDWTIRYCDTQYMHQSLISSLLRYFYYIFFPLNIVFSRKNYGTIIAWQQFLGLNFAFWCRLFKIKNENKLIVLTYIYKRKKGILGNVYHKYMKYILNSGCIDKIICFSKEEPAYYSELFGVKGLFEYIPLGVKPIGNSEISSFKGNYVFTAGRSNRDYNFLFDSFQNENIECTIACDDISESAFNKGENIKILKNCYNEDMYNLMDKSLCVVVTLKDENISSGQLVCLQALSIGKPIIVTAAKGVSDYIIDGENGIIIEKKKERLLEAISKLKNDDVYYRTISSNALKSYQENYTETKMFQNIARIAKAYN